MQKSPYNPIIPLTTIMPALSEPIWALYGVSSSYLRESSLGLLLNAFSPVSMDM